MDRTGSFSTPWDHHNRVTYIVYSFSLKRNEVSSLQLLPAV